MKLKIVTPEGKAEEFTVAFIKELWFTESGFHFVANDQRDSGELLANELNGILDYMDIQGSKAMQLAGTTTVVVANTFSCIRGIAIIE